jgi:hypothetical protein
LLQPIGLPGGDETKESMNGRESYVARRDTIPALFFQVLKKEDYLVRVDVVEVKVDYVA